MNIRNKRTIFGAIAITTALLTSCNSNQQQPTPPTPTEEEKEEVANTISKILPCNSPFIAITNICNVDITYTPGEYKIEAIGDSTLIARLNTTFDSGTLTISLTGDNQVELSTVKTKQNIRLDISSPELKIVSTCNNGSFESKGTIHTDVFQIGNLGSGNMKLDSIVCKSFRADNNDLGSIELEHIQCTTAMFTSIGTSSTSAQIKAEKNISIITGEKSSSAIDAESESIVIASRNNSAATLNLTCTDLTATAINNAEITLNGNAKTKSIKSTMGSKVIDNVIKE